MYLERGGRKIPTACAMELFMTANVSECGDLVREEGIVTEENGWKSNASKSTWLMDEAGEDRTTKRGR